MGTGLLLRFAIVCSRLSFYATVWVLLIVSLPVNTSAQTELFFSEYIEGSSNNKAIEVFNGTGSNIDLSAGAYDVQFFFNGSVDAGRTLALSGILASGDVFVLAHTSADAAILAEADILASGLWFNGDDAVVLRRGGVIIDAIGQAGFDPGTEWGSGDASTADNTLRRKTGIGSGDTNATDAFEPPVEWDGFAVDTFDGLGSHGGAPPVSPQVTLTVDQSQIPENGGNALVTANLTQTAVNAVTVTLEFMGSATGAAQDYSASDNVITIAPATASGSISIQTVDDNLEEGSESIVVNILSVTNATEVGEQSVTVEILDDDDAAGIIITQSNGTTRVTEGGNGDDYTVVLSATPSAEVVIAIDPDEQTDVGNGPDQAVVLTFTPENALTAQTVVVAATDDDLIEGVHSGSITHSASSQDSRYDNLSITDLSVEIIDNDSDPDPETCAITTIELVGLTGCSAAGNTYEADIRVTFDNAPSGGSLIVNGQTFSVSSSPAVVTLSGLPADGRAVDVTAGFEGCELTESDLFIAPEPCSESETIDDVIAQVQSLLQDSDTPKRALKYLKKAKSKLRKARTKLQRGAIESGFKNMSAAVEQLQRASKRGAETESAVDAVVTFARGIAESSLLEAETYSAVPGVNRHLKEARSRLLRGDEKRGSGKADKAIDCYGQAHDQAQRAIRKGRKNRSLSKDNVVASAALPQHFVLAPNYPNPFNPTTTISFSIPTPAEVRLEIFNLQGRLVRNLVAGSLPPGNHLAVWDGLDQEGNAVATGVYVYRFQAAEFRASRKLLLIR